MQQRAERTHREAVDEYERTVPEQERPVDLVSRSVVLSYVVSMAGFLGPLVVAVVAYETFTSHQTMVVAVFGTLVVADVALVWLGMTGRGAPGMVQPWKWSAHLVWLGMRLLLFATLVWNGPNIS